MVGRGGRARRLRRLWVASEDRRVASVRCSYAPPDANVARLATTLDVPLTPASGTGGPGCYRLSVIPTRIGS